MEKLLLLPFGPLVVAAALLIIATGIRRFVLAFRSRLTPEQIKAAQEAYLSRLLNPQVDAVERKIGKLLPERLLQLYRDRSTIQSGGFRLEKPGQNRWKPERWPVYCFEPLDAEALNGWQYDHDLGPGFCFATRAGDVGTG